MTYRNKLLLKRLLVILAILIAVILVALLVGFTYLGRFVVYSEDGITLDRGNGTAVTASPVPSLPKVNPEDVVVIMGSTLDEETAIGNEHMKPPLKDYEVSGILVDFETLQDARAVNSIDLSDESLNTLVLEMRADGSDLANSAPVNSLISRALSQDDLHLVAMISAFQDGVFVPEHPDAGLRVWGGTYFYSDNMSYWLDPAAEEVQDYLVDTIRTLAEMGFEEVILNDFYFPENTRIDYPATESRETIMQQACVTIQERVGSTCRLGLLVKDYVNGHQVMDQCNRIYVGFESGSSLGDYTAAHPGKYVVFITSSHDTRFNDYGKLQAAKSYSEIDESAAAAE